MWIVVNFIDENSVEVVPREWFKSGICMWPDCRGMEKLRRMVENKETPLHSWVKCRARQIGEKCYSSLKIAREKSILAEVTSDINSEVEGGKRKRYRNGWISSGSDDDIDETVVSKKIPQPPVFSQTTPIQTGVVVTSTPCDTVSHSLLASSSLQKSDISGKYKPMTGFEKEVLRNLAFLRRSLEDVQERLKAIEGKSTTPAVVADNTIETVLAEYPIKDSIHLQAIEEKLHDPSYKENMVTKLSYIGGNSAKDSVLRILRTVLTDEVAAEFSWLGLKKKKIFADLKLKNVMFDAVRRSKWAAGVTDKDLEMFAKDWLRHAKFRADRREKKEKSVIIDDHENENINIE